MYRIIFAVYILHAKRVMIPGRCNSLSIVRLSMHELSKKQCSTEARRCYKNFYQSESTVFPIIGRLINR